MSLYQLTQEFIQIKSQLESAELDEQLVKDTLEAYDAPLEEKAEQIIKWMRDLEARATMKKEEAKRLKESADADQQKADSLKKALDYMMQATGKDKLAAGLFQIGYRKGSESVVIDETKLPAAYFIPQKPVPIPKPELKKLLKEGKEIPGVQLVRGQPSLQIK